ncbi:alpha/beta hydrolase [Paraburkholderia caribensis]|uniref:Alpha/beta hydrolase n=1 Tax=Paraburkholderia caribensis TaxID=75105 RepID=A0A9Q6S3N0_9BURK|nr:alpha/beta hydrolase [Paraburkholderia caribensis]MCO4877786.1 alpha/beta hydrolase [Paraburkholderia caribensis]PTB24931.1 alpha/beta hydrolase [Paraburkholderia caribensis]QLB64225.1 alpha/beta hydrolase [Paraburkholderia caribensis]
MSNHPAIDGLTDRMAASWQARAVLMAMPLFVGRCARARCVAPDVARLRVRSHWLSLPGAGLAALCNPRSRRVRDGGLDGLWTLPSSRPGPIANAILYLHGGGYYFGSSATHRAVTTALAAHSGAPVFAPDYRLAPEHPFPAALNDALHAYRTLIARGIAANSIVVAGDSAGGGLALALLVALRDAGDALPAGAVMFSPWADLTTTWRAARGAGPTTRIAMQRAAQMYIGDASAWDPYVSPARGDLHDLPPIHLQISDAEAMYEDALALAARLNRVGVTVQVAQWHAMPHALPCFAPFLPEANQALRQAAMFVRRCYATRKREAATAAAMA